MKDIVNGERISLTDNVVHLENYSCTTTIIEIEEGSLGFELPWEVMSYLDIKTGDTVIWEETDNGYIMKKKVEKCLD